MKRNLFVLATACICLVIHISAEEFTADKNFLQRQKAIFSLFWHTDQPTTVLPELYQIARSWSIEDHIGSFNNETVVHDFVLRLKHGLIRRHAVISIFHPEHLDEVVGLVKLFYHAKDFETFYNTAVWARFNVNEALFTYALTVAVIHRPDTRHMRLPALYELVPHFFFNNEVIQLAYRAKMGDANVKQNVGIKYHDGGDVVIHSNYSGWYISHGHEHQDEKLNYFSEDIGLSAAYFYFMHEFPFYMSSHEFNLPKGIRGENYYYGHKQLLARYYLERLSNDLGEIQHIDWHQPITTGYYPTLNHPNGLPFPQRESNSRIPHFKYDLVHELEEIDSRLCSAIDSGYFYDKSRPPKRMDLYTPEGFNYLGELIEGNADSINKRYFQSFDHVCRKVFGFGVEPIDKNHLVPSALEYYGTCTRDPAFYRIVKKIVSYFLKYKEHLPKYTRDELLLSGVKIESVEIDELLTYFEHFDSNINNGIPVSSQQDAETSIIKVRQHRLNHKPFTYHLKVNSDKDVKASIRIFMGPKYDEHGHELNFNENYVNFFEVDQWIVDLKAGSNAIERSCHESVIVSDDQESSYLFWNKLNQAIESGGTLSFSKHLFRYPDRLLLPKGKREGFPVQFFFFINEYSEAQSVKLDLPIWGYSVSDGKAMGYPLDRPVSSYVFDIPNAYFKDAVIIHKQVDESNLNV